MRNGSEYESEYVLRDGSKVDLVIVENVTSEFTSVSNYTVD